MQLVNLSEHYPYKVAGRLINAKGEAVDYDFKVSFKRLKVSEIRAISQKLSNGELDDDALVNQLVVGFEGITDADGAAMGFSAENLNRITDVVGVAPAILDAWRDSLRAGAQKN